MVKSCANKSMHESLLESFRDGATLSTTMNDHQYTVLIISNSVSIALTTNN